MGNLPQPDAAAMEPLLTERQKASYKEFKRFVASNVQPFVEEWDRAQRHPESVIFLLGKVGYLGSSIPLKYAGQGWDFVTFGLLSEAFGRESPALSNLLTVQVMVAMTLLKWGTEEQKRTWIPQLAKGNIIGAFALTEPGAGSATQSLQTGFRQNNGSFILNGQKKWISYGQTAGVFLVFGKLEEEFVACLVPREAAGVQVEPIREMLGFRAAGLATITFHDVEVPSLTMVGKPGFALSHIAPVGLHYGRMATACSAAGVLRACFEESVSYGATRKIGDQIVGDIGIIQSLIARLGSDLQAARLLFYAACRAEDEHLPERFAAALIAKYYNSKAAVRGSSDAVQIRGASGCHESSSVARHYRDAKLMEILEGTTQVHEHMLAKIFTSQAAKLKTLI
jgi:alkylation response protein AidB-like acyl-CoA dehydrogenase